jgi:hypothetical protein
MDTNAYRLSKKDAALFHIKNLELAPEGWRTCVEKVAEGFAEVMGEHAYCLNCSQVVQGAQGHDITCLTMVARRILANEPLLHAQRTRRFLGVDIDVVHASRAAPLDVPASVPYVRARRTVEANHFAPVDIPTFLPRALSSGAK